MAGCTAQDPGRGDVCVTPRPGPATSPPAGPAVLGRRRVLDRHVAATVAVRVLRPFAVGFVVYANAADVALAAMGPVRSGGRPARASAASLPLSSARGLAVVRGHAVPLPQVALGVSGLEVGPLIAPAPRPRNDVVDVHPLPRLDPLAADAADPLLLLAQFGQQRRQCALLRNGELLRQAVQDVVEVPNRKSCTPLRIGSRGSAPRRGRGRTH